MEGAERVKEIVLCLGNSTQRDEEKAKSIVIKSPYGELTDEL